MHKETTFVELSVIERDTLQALSEGLKWEDIAERLQQGSLEVKMQRVGHILNWVPIN
jgi:hypothetical protein